MQDGPGNRVGELPAAAQAWWSARFARCAADELACEFFAALDVRGLSRNTLIAYGRAVEDLIAFSGPLQSLKFNMQSVMVSSRISGLFATNHGLSGSTEIAPALARHDPTALGRPARPCRTLG